MQVAYKMDDELQRLGPFRPGELFVKHVCAGPREFGDYTVAVIRGLAVPGRIICSFPERDVYKMPVGGFWTGRANQVTVVCHRGQTVVSQQSAHLRLCRRR